ncbi:MAG: YibE/F family protein [Oscillospiraceae bacterium]|nr:YibE/F family protein [Oscillospiraceae bacterium]
MKKFQRLHRYLLPGAGVALSLGGIVLLVLSILGYARIPELLSSGLMTVFGVILVIRSLRNPGTSALSLLILSMAAGVFFFAYEKAQLVPSIPQSTVHAGISYEKAEVLEVERNEYQRERECEDVPVGKQYLSVELISGDYKGLRFNGVVNNLSYFYGTVVQKGDRVTLAVVYENGQVTDLVMQDYDRTKPLLIVLGIFLAITILVGGKVGAKSLLGLSLTFICTFSVLIPLLIGGAPTLPTILGMCAFVTVVEFVILDGVNKKTLCAILGTISGVVIAAVFGEIACSIMRINGFKTFDVDSVIEALLQIKQSQTTGHSIQLGDLLVGGILIAALGAVNDVAMSISSAMKELITVNPNLSRKELLKSGMTIGRDMVGTMTNTLILAFVGSGLIMMIYLVSLEPSFQQLMSTTYMSVEVVQGVASSVGVILAVPLSVIIGTVLFGHKKEKDPNAAKGKAAK